MAWNPNPKVGDCREIARKWNNQDMVIIIAVASEGQMTMATYGKTPSLCNEARVYGDAAFEAVMKSARGEDDDFVQGDPGVIIGGAP